MVTSIWLQTILFTQDSVDRFSYRTIFVANGQVAINAQFWGHTFILELPGANLKTLPIILCKQPH